MSSHKISTVILLITAVLLLEIVGASPVFASFCHISNISYNYPQQLTLGQSFLTSTTVSGICASDDSYFYSIRVDLNDMSGQVLSYTAAPIGYGGLNRQVTLQNLVTAPMNVGPWQIQFIVYIFANIASGGTIDSKTTQPVTIQVGTLQTTQATQTIPSVTTVSQTTVPTFGVNARTFTSRATQTVDTGPSSEKIYFSIVAIIGILLLVTILLLTQQRQVKQVKKERKKENN